MDSDKGFVVLWVEITRFLIDVADRATLPHSEMFGLWVDTSFALERREWVEHVRHIGLYERIWPSVGTLNWYTLSASGLSEGRWSRRLL